MSYLTYGLKGSKKLFVIRDLWPEKVAWIGGEDIPAEELEPWQLVPRTPEMLWDWCYPSKREEEDIIDRSRKFDVIYGEELSEPDEPPVVLSVRVQGFLSRFTFAPLGNWGGDGKDCPGAIQSLNLIGGPMSNELVWKHTVEATNDVLRNIYAHLKSLETFSPLHVSLPMQRRVFTKVTPKNRSEKYRLPSRADDPKQYARRVEDNWRIFEDLRLGVLDEDGFTTSSKHVVFSEGDFVNVSMSFDVFELRSGGIKVHLCPDEVIQMVPKMEVEKLILSKALQGYVAPTLPVKNKAVKRGFFFYEDMEPEANSPWKRQNIGEASTSALSEVTRSGGIASGAASESAGAGLGEDTDMGSET